MPSPFRSVLWATSAGLLAVGASLALGAAWPRKQSSPPPPLVDSAARIAQGRAYFTASCAHCHADDATGDEGPDLHKLKISDAHIALLVKNGIKGEMPTFAKKYDDAQIATIAAYLRSLE
jgi:mono/diheme cytochrome c family protein